VPCRESKSEVGDSEVSDLDNLEEGEVRYTPKGDREVFLLYCTQDKKKYLAIRQRANYDKLHLLCRGRSLSKAAYLPLWHKLRCVDRIAKSSPGLDWTPYTVEVGDAWKLLKTLPARTLTDWVVSPWLDSEVNPLKPTGTKKLSGLSAWSDKLAEARELLDAVKTGTSLATTCKEHGVRPDKSQKGKLELGQAPPLTRSTKNSSRNEA